ncbi:phosphate transport system ATP-binding protein [Thermosulfidibacter takaii ABI70S6]|uniref:Phosphate transport system ATP-binding protein n=1 Tax=Thermosulfidibacter takaii (strain DSM 17441 / JCM 13301 / NBRC 103674 / ABI70S6) TaxID=1298851 RepID=A0A0S3QRA4_THET7|nr:phosphate ABC transporter ATP-binding protein PstB [Thermosulfidibacter takaii]BAT70874.1 phosphate transport system ATP-binding protein [Thermosulfidibacter takaii ABI70S6]
MGKPVISIQNLQAGYDKHIVLKNINMDIPEHKVLAIMGPSGCGKSTLIRCINRLHEMIPKAFMKGEILFKDKSIFKYKPYELRKRIGMVFQRPNPFPNMTIYENILAGYILNGTKLKKEEKDAIVEDALKKAFLWDEVKDMLHKRGTELSGGQQQRLCIARALALNPEVLLLDEPTSALDPKATHRIEELIVHLKQSVTIVVVTHNASQAARISDLTAFLYQGQLVEFSNTESVFTNPKHKLTEEFLLGKFGNGEDNLRGKT